ncbi:MAG: hypothetical protein SFY81_12925 [Verrucomicrobiota bacterium]|nr:hypothetical protein [Verrucomicrobiota bacterium]
MAKSKKWLIVIESDPARSGKALEALRVAAGVAVWKRVQVAVHLRGAAVHLLAPDAGLENELITTYLKILKEEQCPVTTDGDSFSQSVADADYTSCFSDLP